MASRKAAAAASRLGPPPASSPSKQPAWDLRRDLFCGAACPPGMPAPLAAPGKQPAAQGGAAAASSTQCSGARAARPSSESQPSSPITPDPEAATPPVQEGADAGAVESAGPAVGTKRRAVARSLFGPPPSRRQLDAFFEQAEDEARDRFSAKWGFDVLSGQPREDEAEWDWAPVEGQADRHAGVLLQ